MASLRSHRLSTVPSTPLSLSRHTAPVEIRVRSDRGGSDGGGGGGGSSSRRERVEGKQIAALVVQLFAQGKESLMHGRVTQHLTAVCLRSGPEPAEDAALVGQPRHAMPDDRRLARDRRRERDWGWEGWGGEGGHERLEGLQGRARIGGERGHGVRSCVAVDAGDVYEELAEVRMCPLKMYCCGSDCLVLMVITYACHNADYLLRSTAY